MCQNFLWIFQDFRSKIIFLQCNTSCSSKISSLESKNIPQYKKSEKMICRNRKCLGGPKSLQLSCRVKPFLHWKSQNKITCLVSLLSVTHNQNNLFIFEGKNFIILEQAKYHGKCWLPLVVEQILTPIQIVQNWCHFFCAACHQFLHPTQDLLSSHPLHH